MPRSWIHTVCWVGFVVLAIGIGNLAAQETQGNSPISADTKSGTVPCETLLPETTQGFFAISNVDMLSEHWHKTQLGHLMDDPVMEPFIKDLRRQLEERWSSVHDRLGLTIEDMKGVPGGDVGIGLIAPVPGKAALAIVIDVSGKLPQANEMLKKVTDTPS